MNKYKAFCESLARDGASPEIINLITAALNEDASRYPPQEKILEWLNEPHYDNVYDQIVKRTVEWVYETNPLLKDSTSLSP
jgi:hypothetical protein